MIPIKLQLFNFMSYQGPETLDFQSFDLAVLSGDNGVGKSTLLEAITWAVWGKSRAGSDDDLIRHGTNSMWVEFIFDHEDGRYRIIRRRNLKGRPLENTRGRGESKLDFASAKRSKNLFTDDWENLSEPLIKKTQEKIIETLKLRYEIFTNSAYLRQGHADEFTVKTPAERKEILAEVLELERYQGLSELAKEKQKHLLGEEEAINFQLEELKQDLAEGKGVPGQLKKTIEAQKILAKKFSGLQEESKKSQREKQQFELAKQKIDLARQRALEIQEEMIQTKNEIDRLETKIIEIEKTLANKEKILKDFENLKKLEKLNEEYNHKLQEASHLREKLSVFDHKKENLASTVSRLQKISICPTCLRKLTQEEAIKIIKDLKKDFARKELPEYQKLQKLAEKIGYDEKKHQEIKNQIDKYQFAEEAKQNLDLSNAQLKDKQILQEKNQIDFRAKNLTLQKIIKDGKALRAITDKLNHKIGEWQKLETEIENLQAEISENQTLLGTLKEKSSQLAASKKEFSEKEKRLKEIGEEKGIYEELAYSFGKKGIQAMIIEQSIPAIEEEANLLLKKITDGAMSLKLITQKEKKTNEDEIIETLEIRIADSAGERAYEMFSGGEAFRINFALRIALSKILTHRAGAKLEFLVIDEGFGMLDTAGREEVTAAINSISSDFKKVMIVTHIQELKDLFPTRIDVTKDETGSHFAIVG